MATGKEPGWWKMKEINSVYKLSEKGRITNKQLIWAILLSRNLIKRL